MMAIQQVKKMVSSPYLRRKESSGPRVFGAPLSQQLLCQVGESNVPAIVKRLCDFILQHGTRLEGVFRVSSSLKSVSRLKTSLEKDLNAKLEDVICCSMVLKSFLRELPGGVVPEPLAVAWMGLARMEKSQTSEMVSETRRLIQQLPPLNMDLFCYICRFLYDFSKHSDCTRMTSQALSVVIAPNIFRFEQIQEDLKYQNAKNSVMCFMIEHCHDVFPQNQLSPEPSPPLSSREHCKSPSKGRRSSESALTLALLSNTLTRGMQRSISMEPDAFPHDATDSIRQSFPDSIAKPQPHDISLAEESEVFSEDDHADIEEASPGKGASRKQPPNVIADAPTKLGNRFLVKDQQLSEAVSSRPMEERRIAFNFDDYSDVDFTHPIRREIPNDVIVNPDEYLLRPRNLTYAVSPCGKPVVKTRVDTPIKSQPLERATPTFPTRTSACSFGPTGWNEHPDSALFQSRLLSGRGDLGDQQSTTQDRCNSLGTSRTVLDDSIVRAIDNYMFGTMEENLRNLAKLRSSDSLPGDTPSSQQHQLSAPGRDISIPVGDLGCSNIDMYSTTPLSSLLEEDLRQYMTYLRQVIQNFEDSFKMEYGRYPSCPEERWPIKQMLKKLSQVRKEHRDRKVSSEQQDPEHARSHFLLKSRSSPEDFILKVNTSIDRKRFIASRPLDPLSMTLAQLHDEKVVLQQALKEYEHNYGRPTTTKERQLTKHLYDRYKSIKRLLAGEKVNCKPTQQPFGPPRPFGSISVQVHELMVDSTQGLSSDTSSLRSSLLNTKSLISHPDSSEGDSLLGASPLKASPQKELCFTNGMPSSPRHADRDSVHELQAQKRSLCEQLKRFERDFELVHKRSVSKSDREPMRHLYDEYKKVKAKLHAILPTV